MYIGVGKYLLRIYKIYLYILICLYIGKEFMLSNCGAGEDSWEFLGLQGHQTSQWKSTLKIHWKDWWWSWSSNTLATWCEEPTHWKSSWCWERLRTRGGGADRGWDGWMASQIQGTWVWANSRKPWRAGKPGTLQLMGLQRIIHKLVPEQQQKFSP